MSQKEKKNNSGLSSWEKLKPLEICHYTQNKLLLQISLVSYAFAQFCLEFFSPKDTSLPISAEVVSLFV